MRQATLDDVFSLLPKRNAALAALRIQERMKKPARLRAYELRWAEFDLQGNFIRGAISDISDLTTITLGDPAADPYIHLLARRARLGDIEAGHLEWIGEGECFLWYLPFRCYDENGSASVRLRGLAVDFDIFREVTALFNGSADLTQAETRLLFQLVAGIEMRAAASMDGIAYETKRSHAKSAASKLNCAGQKDLVRKAMGQLVHLMSVGDADLRQVETAAAFAASHFGAEMEFVVRPGRSGRTLRYLVGGPADGAPVVLVHGMMFPVVLRGLARHLHENGLRLFVPIRPGYLESRPLGPLFEIDDLIARGHREIIDIVEDERLSRPLLIGNSLGAGVALQLAARRPDLFSGVTLLSANLAEPGDSDRERGSAFYRGMHVIKSNAQLFKLVNLEYRRFYAHSETCRHILRTHFAGSPNDLEVLEGAGGNGPVYPMFASSYSSSIVGIAEDFRHAMSQTKSGSGQPDLPVSIIHGDDDPLTSYEDVAAPFAASGRAGDVRIAGAGHFAAVSHGDIVWSNVAALCRANTRAVGRNAQAGIN